MWDNIAITYDVVLDLSQVMCDQYWLISNMKFTAWGPSQAAATTGNFKLDLLS